MAKLTVVRCDMCQSDIQDGKGGSVVVIYSKGRKQADVCDKCADGLPGVLAKRRGRKPKDV